MSDGLDVYLHGQRVGRLWLNDRRRFCFGYAADWLTTPQAVPLSLALPLRESPYLDDTARPFFRNLLPEAAQLSLIARRLGISEGNDYRLLEAIGGECAGAVSLLPEGVPPDPDGGYRPLTPAQLDALIEELPKHPMLAGEQGLRLSLAGVQSKLPVHYQDGTVSLAEGQRPSTHILKPPIAHLPDTAVNELFCMTLAANVGLPVPVTALLPTTAPTYLVERYDRTQGPHGEIQRLHQEDLCQALGIAPEQKYEQEGGPSLHACFSLIRAHSIQPVADIKALLAWVGFNYLIGNADAHGKNLSLLLGPNGPRLAPFYDLLSTGVYPELTERLAMRIGGEARPGWITAERWQRFASESGIGYRLVRTTLLELAARLPTEAKEQHHQFTQAQGECATLGRILALIEQRAAKLTRILSANHTQATPNP